MGIRFCAALAILFLQNSSWRLSLKKSNLHHCRYIFLWWHACEFGQPPFLWCVWYLWWHLLTCVTQPPAEGGFGEKCASYLAEQVRQLHLGGGLLPPPPQLLAKLKQHENVSNTVKINVFISATFLILCMAKTVKICISLTTYISGITKKSFCFSVILSFSHFSENIGIIGIWIPLKEDKIA